MIGNKMILCRMISIVIGACLDRLIGDPQWMPHPVRWIGSLVSALEKLLRLDGDSPAIERIKGGATAVFVLSVVTQISWGLLVRAYAVHTLAGIALESILCCYALAARSLQDASMEVYSPLVADKPAPASGQNIERARHAVLDEKGIIRAAVETVAENTADGVIAPLFYMMLGGAAGAMAYKAVNTMDSMIGYRNEKYQYYGTVAARLDDIAGFIPARLSGLLLVAAAKLTGMDAAGAWRTFKRDRYAHKSPNSAQSESACAGALGVQLAGDAVYFGRVVKKPFIGDPTREIEAEDIPRTNRLMYTASGLCLVLVIACLAVAALVMR